jgi:dolichol-phosphate mannosyltransferase
VKSVLLIPTYDEKDNITPLLQAIAELAIPGLEVLVVDDCSPDGTAEAVDIFARDHAFVSLLCRAGSRGRGNAGREGYLTALARGADLILEMDADFSHHPRYLPALIAAADEYDVVLGSRFVSGGEDADRARWRKVVTLLANFYIRVMFGISVRDANSGYRCFRRQALERIDPASLQSAGPAIVQEVLFRAQRRGLRVGEIPVVFTDRVRGDSKLGFRQLYQGYVAVLRLRVQELLGRSR